MITTGIVLAFLSTLVPPTYSDFNAGMNILLTFSATVCIIIGIN